MRHENDVVTEGEFLGDDGADDVDVKLEGVGRRIGDGRERRSEDAVAVSFEGSNERREVCGLVPRAVNDEKGWLGHLLVSLGFSSSSVVTVEQGI